MAKSQSELALEFVESLQAASPELTDTNEGSDIDIITQTVSTAVSELQEISNTNLRKTFFNTANGPAATGGPDDLQTLAVDHFGEDFARPEATYSTGIVTFSRPTSAAGAVLIPQGTVVKTKKTSLGESISFETEIDVTLSALALSTSVTAKALAAGPSSNVLANTITEIEVALSDASVVVNNAQSFSGGVNELNDAEYRIFIKRLIQTIKGATLKAIESKALTVSGVAYAKAIELLLMAKEWTGVAAIGDVIKIPRLKLYVSDANGSANTTLIQSVRDAVATVRAGGVIVEIFGANPLTINWTGQVTLNPLGPNYSTLQNDLTTITDEMKNYITNLPIGQSFVKSVANNHILSKFGPAGTNDLTAFYTLLPTADVSATATDKFVYGVVSL